MAEPTFAESAAIEQMDLEGQLRFEAAAMKAAPSEIDTPGTLHFMNWFDKPHRVLYSACDLMVKAADEIARLNQELADRKKD